MCWRETATGLAAGDGAAGWHDRLADLPRAARGLTATAVGDGRICLFGGYAAASDEEADRSPDRGYLRQVLVYDALADTISFGRSHRTYLGRPSGW